MPLVEVAPETESGHQSGPQIPEAFRDMWRVTTPEEAFEQIAPPLTDDPVARIEAGYERLSKRYSTRPVKRGDSGELPGERYPA